VVRLASGFARLGLALSVAFLVLALLRWRPVYAETPLDVKALPLALPAVLFACLAALTGRERSPRRWRPVAVALGIVVAGLVIVVAIRGPAGLRGEVAGPKGYAGRTAAGPVELIGRDLPGRGGPGRWTLRWAGPLRVPRPGPYRLWVQGRGRVEVSVGGHVLLRAQGDPLAAETTLALARGAETLEVTYEHRGPGPRLRLGWTRPDGRSETIPPRYLGPSRRGWRWGLTDTLALAAAALAAALLWLLPWDRPRRPASPRPVTMTELILSACGYALLLTVMSWPLVCDLVHSGPLERPDGRLNAWILAWAGTTFWTAPGRVFQAPIFHPLPDALAFSENLLLPAALVAPLEALGGPVLAYNVALLLSLLVSGLGVQLLVRRASGDRLAAFVAGAYFAAGPHRWTRLAHLHAQVTFGLPFVLLALDRFWDRRSLRRALGVGLMLALQGLASIYLGVITATTLAVAVLVAVFGGLRTRELLRLAVGFLLAAAILAPVARPYLRMRAFEGVEFTLETVSVYATNLTSYTAAGTALWGPLTQRHLDPAEIRDTLFPGLTVLVLGILGLAAAPRRYRAVALVASAAAVVLSLGPETGLYRFLHEHVVLVRGVRALSRFALVPMLALAVLSGLALSGRRRLVLVGALALMMLESQNLPLHFARYDGPPPAARWLAGKQGAVLYLPLAVDDTQVMLDGLAHRLPLVNGDSGFIPRPFDRAMELLQGPLGKEPQRFLRAVGVRHVVASAALVPVGLPLAASFPGESIFELPAEGETASVVAEGAMAPTLWTSAGPVLDLEGIRRLGRVVFELSDGAWVSHPRVEASVDGETWEPLDAMASLADATLSLYRDPRHARGEVRFPPLETRFLRLDPRLPARPGALEVGL
jgi:PA14 domain